RLCQHIGGVGHRPDPVLDEIFRLPVLFRAAIAPHAVEQIFDKPAFLWRHAILLAVELTEGRYRDLPPVPQSQAARPATGPGSRGPDPGRGGPGPRALRPRAPLGGAGG